LHAWSGLIEKNNERTLHGEAAEQLWDFVKSAGFWFQSFQNWQSEFLSVGVLILLSIYLRERNSPQSKKVGAPHSATGD
jgi:hypothetical protein